MSKCTLLDGCFQALLRLHLVWGISKKTIFVYDGVELGYKREFAKCTSFELGDPLFSTNHTSKIRQIGLSNW